MGTVFVRQIPGSVEQFAGEFVFFATDTVGAFIGPLVDVPLVVELADEFLYSPLVALFSCANEVVIASINGVEYGKPGLFDKFVCPLLGGDTVGVRGAHDLFPVFISSGEEPYVMLPLPVPPGEDVCSNSGVGVPDMGGVVDVVDRGGEVERCQFSGHGLILWVLLLWWCRCPGSASS